MTSVNDILEQLELKTEDLNNLTPTLIQKIFSVLTVIEISLLCGTSKKFNTICKRESLWKNKILDSYGVRKKYGKTWRETAKNMSQVNMIDLDEEWINGETYNEILNKSLERDDILEYIDEIRLNALIELFGEENKSKINFTLHELTGESEVQLHIEDEEYPTLDIIFNEQTKIIHLSLFNLSRNELSLFSKQNDLFIGRFSVAHLIDPIIYIMHYSTFKKSDLDDALLDYLTPDVLLPPVFIS